VSDERGDVAEARAELEHLVRHGIDRLPSDANLVSALAELAEACAIIGDGEHGAAVYARLGRWPDRTTASMRGLGSWGHTGSSLGRLAHLLGRPDEARAHFERALEGNERMGADAWTARTSLHYAAFLADAGDASARERGSEALATAERLGLDGLVARWGPRLASGVA